MGIFAAGVAIPFLLAAFFFSRMQGLFEAISRHSKMVGALSSAFIIFFGLLLVTEHVPALQIGRWDPVWPWDLFAEIVAFATTVGSVAYLVNHAVRQLRHRERALAEARERAALELEVLTNTLDELEGGLEVVEKDGAVIWRNKRAEQLAPAIPEGHDHWACPGDVRACEQDVTGVCPVRNALDEEYFPIAFGAGAPGSYIAETGAPRTFGFSVRLAF